MTSDDEHTLVFKAVSGVSVREGGQTVAIEFQASSGQTISVIIPADASHTLSRMLMRTQIEAAAERAVHRPPKPDTSGALLPSTTGRPAAEHSDRAYPAHQPAPYDQSAGDDEAI